MLTPVLLRKKSQVMEELEISANPVEEAIQPALERLSLGREEVKVAVLNEGRGGISGRRLRRLRLEWSP